MHLRSVSLHSDSYPDKSYYPFNLPLFTNTRTVEFEKPVTIFVGENGTGKSTLLQAITRSCGIYIWDGAYKRIHDFNQYEDKLYRYLAVQWTDEPVPGAFFGANLFQHFARIVDQWAATDPGQLDYFGGRSLTTLSHGQSLMAYFNARCRSKGIFFLDEPETALSPRSQLALLDILREAGTNSQSQFIIATHSPILMACPGADILNFDKDTLESIRYEDTDHYRIYRQFMNDPGAYAHGRQRIG